jgi:hypothetical protein
MECKIENITSYEYQSFPPTQKTVNNHNSPNKDLEYEIPIGDGFQHPYNYDAYMQYELVERDTNTQYNDDDKVRLVDNFFPQLFSQILIKIHGFIVGTYDYPGVTSTALNTCLLSPQESKAYIASGFETPIGKLKNAKGTHEVLFKLRLLGGFFNYYTDIMYKGGLTIIFKRKSDDNMAVHVWDEAGKTTTKPGKVVIKSMEIRVPIVQYDPIYEIKLKSSLIQKPVPINFLASQTIQKSVSGSRFEFDLTTQFISQQFDMPDFVIVIFQTDRENANQKNYAAYFDHCKVRNISIKNGRNEVFPAEDWNLDIANNQYLKMYDAYTSLKRVMSCSTDIYYSPEDFIKKRPMYVLNTSKRRRKVDCTDKTNISLVINFAEQVSDKTLCYVIMLGNKYFDYDIKNQRITEHI